MIKAIRASLESKLQFDDPTGVMTQADNSSLLLNRYLRNAADGEPAYREAADSLLKYVQKACANVDAVYRAAFERWRSTFEAAECHEYTTSSRVLVGFGGHHVLETGLTLNPVYGLPFVPGTALKGLAAHYCHRVWGADNVGFRGDQGREGEFYRVLFGSTDEGGLIEYHDAWILPDSVRSCLLDDILTPHHGDYYGGANDPPADYDDPVPVHFLSVSGRFLICVTSSTPNDSDRWRELAQTLLRSALADWGVGGKTNQGYGRMQRS